jgi:RimJ/RimL family protein N-acetyltransferase
VNNDPNLKNKVTNLHSISELQEIFVRDGVTLIPLNNTHALRILEILQSDKNIRDRVTVASRLHTTEDVAAEIEAYCKDTGLIRYAIIEQNNVVGLVSLWRDDGFFGTPANTDDYGFGYFLDPSARGRGLVTSAIVKLINVVQSNLPVRQFVAFCDPNNTDSIAVLTKLGYEPTGETFIEPNNGWKEEKYIRAISK